MASNTTVSKPVISRRHSYLLLASGVATYLMIVMGGIVCVTGSGTACPDWPGCYGRAIPPLQMNAIIEYLHRFVAGLAFPLIVGAAIVSWRKARSIRYLSRPPVVAVVLTLVVSGFGAMTVLRGLPPELAVIDLGLALTILALLMTATTAAFAHRADPSLPDKLSGRSLFARLTFGALGATFLALISGVLVAGKGSLTRCLGWPMWRGLAGDVSGWPQTMRLILAIVASLLIVAMVVQAWRTQRQQVAIFRIAMVVGLLFVLEIVVSLLILIGGAAIFLYVIHVMIAAALWAMMVVLATLVGLVSAAVTDPR